MYGGPDTPSEWEILGERR